MTSEQSKDAFKKQKDEAKAKAHNEYKRLEAKIEKAKKDIEADTTSIANAEKELIEAKATLDTKRKTRQKLRAQRKLMSSPVQRKQLDVTLVRADAAVSKAEKAVGVTTTKVDERHERKRKHEEDLQNATESKKKKKETAATILKMKEEENEAGDDMDVDEEDCDEKIGDDGGK